MAIKHSPGCECCESGCSIASVKNFLDGGPGISENAEGYLVLATELPSDGHYTIQLRPDYVGYVPFNTQVEWVLLGSDDSIVARFNHRFTSAIASVDPETEQPLPPTEERAIEIDWLEDEIRIRDTTGPIPSESLSHDFRYTSVWNPVPITRLTVRPRGAIYEHSLTDLSINADYDPDGQIGVNRSVQGFSLNLAEGELEAQGPLRLGVKLIDGAYGLPGENKQNTRCYPGPIPSIFSGGGTIPVDPSFWTSSIFAEGGQTEQIKLTAYVYRAKYAGQGDVSTIAGTLISPDGTQVSIPFEVTDNQVSFAIQEANFTFPIVTGAAGLWEFRVKDLGDITPSIKGDLREWELCISSGGKEVVASTWIDERLLALPEIRIDDFGTDRLLDQDAINAIINQGYFDISGTVGPAIGPGEFINVVFNGIYINAKVTPERTWLARFSSRWVNNFTDQTVIVCKNGPNESRYVFYATPNLFSIAIIPDRNEDGELRWHEYEYADDPNLIKVRVVLDSAVISGDVLEVSDGQQTYRELLTAGDKYKYYTFNRPGNFQEFRVTAKLLVNGIFLGAVIETTRIEAFNTDITSVTVREDGGYDYKYGYDECEQIAEQNGECPHPVICPVTHPHYGHPRFKIDAIGASFSTGIDLLETIRQFVECRSSIANVGSETNYKPNEIIGYNDSEPVPVSYVFTYGGPDPPVWVDVGVFGYWSYDDPAYYSASGINTIEYPNDWVTVTVEVLATENACRWRVRATVLYEVEVPTPSERQYLTSIEAEAGTHYIDPATEDSLVEPSFIAGQPNFPVYQTSGGYAAAWNATENKDMIGFVVEQEVDRWLDVPPTILFTEVDVIEIIGEGAYILNRRTFEMDGYIEVFLAGTPPFVREEWRRILNLRHRVDIAVFSRSDVSAAGLIIGPDDFTEKFPHP